MSSHGGNSKRHPSPVERWGVAGMCGFAALLPWHAFGPHELRSYVFLELALWPLLLSAPAVLLWVWQQRRCVVRSPALLLALSALWLGPLSRAHRLGGLGELWLEVAPGWSLLGVFLAGARGHSRALLRALVWSGAGALVVSLLGWAVAVGLGRARGAFVYASAHPLFPYVPRLTGTFGSHAVWLGEYCLVVLAASWALRADLGQPAVQGVAGKAAGEGVEPGAALARWTSRFAAAGLVLTFSFAWVGGALLACVRAHEGRFPSKWAARGLAGAWALLFVAASWMLVVGLPAPTAGVERAACADFDRSHHLLRRLEYGQCQPLFSEFPYRHRTTLYALAHETTLAVVREQPWLGMRESERDHFAVAYAQKTRGLGTRGYYSGPIGLWAGTLSRGGVLSLLALLSACIFTCWGRWSWMKRRAASEERWALEASSREPACPPRGPALRWCFWGWIASLATATQTDWVLTGPLLLLWGLVLAQISHDREGPRKQFARSLG